MKYFDLHCDTLTELYNNLITFDNDKTQVNKAGTFSYEPYRQVFAIWSDPSIEADKMWDKMVEIASNIDSFAIPKKGSLLAVEGAEILCGKLERLDVMYSLGVRLLTLNWMGRTCIGGGYDTEYGLDRFGISVLRHAFRLGIIPDISHSSVKTFYDCAEIASEVGKPLIASHSNSRNIYDHPRNLTDEQFSTIRELGGIVGVSLCPQHLCYGRATISDVLRHIEHYIMLDGEDTVCIGADFDGIRETPEGLSSVRYISDLAYEMEKRGYGKQLTDKILYGNAADFFDRNLTAAKGWEME